VSPAAVIVVGGAPRKYTSTKAALPENAVAPIDVTPLGTVTDVREVP
jgi:hypothetical protein